MKTRLDPLCRMHLPGMAAAMALASTLALTSTSARADVVWNVNVGNSSVDTDPGNKITTTDNYSGAAFENTAGSTWNAVSSTTAATLEDSTGDNSDGVTFEITPIVSSAIDFGGQNLLSGDKIFNTWIKDNGNNDLFTVSFGNLSPGAEYSLVIYSDWWWGNTAGNPVTQTAGLGLTGTFDINSEGSGQVNGNVGSLLEDTSSLATNSPTTLETNFARFNGPRS